MKKDYSNKLDTSRPSATVEELKLKKRQQKVLRLVIIACFVLFLAANYFVWFSPFFRVEKIEIDGEYNHSLNESLRTILEKHYVGKQTLSIRSSKSKQDVESVVPNLVSISLSRRLPSTLTVHIQQRQAVYRITQPDSASFLADRDGYVFSNDSGGAVDAILVEIPTSTAIGLFSNFLIPEQLTTLSANINQLKALFNIKLTKISQINNLPSQFKLYSQKRWYLMVDIQNNANTTIEMLKTFLLEKYQLEPGLTYIDLRISNSIYYK